MQRKIASIVNGLILLAIIGAFQFASVGFDASIYTKFEFWYKLFYRALLIFLSYKIATDLAFDKSANRKSVTDAKTEYESKNKLKKNDFEEFLSNYNQVLKRNAYENKQKKEIERCKRKLCKLHNKKRIKRIERKKHNLEQSLIDYDINLIRVKFNEVMISDFYVDEILEKDRLDKTRPNYNQAVLKWSSKNIINYLLVSAVMGSAIYSFSVNNSIDFWINFLMDLGIIGYRAIQGFICTDKLYDLEYTISYKNKINILNNYLGENALENDRENKIKAEYENKMQEMKNDFQDKFNKLK